MRRWGRQQLAGGCGHPSGNRRVSRRWRHGHHCPIQLLLHPERPGYQWRDHHRTFTQTVGAPSSFEGQAVTTNSQASVFKKQNTVIGQINQVDYVQASPYLDVGQADQDTHEYTVINTATPLYLPASAKVGSSGTLNAATVYAYTGYPVSSTKGK